MNKSKSHYIADLQSPPDIPDNHIVMEVQNGKAEFRDYGELNPDTQKRIESALAMVHDNIRRTIDADPAGDFAIEPFGEKWWCKIDVIDGALGVGCGIGRYWCSVWIHPDHGVAANCGNVNSDDD